MANHTVGSWDDLRNAAAELVQTINSDERLALAAAANPMYAVEECGYQIHPDARTEIEDRFRFRPEVASRLSELRASIYEQAGEVFDLQSGTALGEVLFDRLHVRPRSGRGSRKAKRPERIDTQPLPPQVGWARQVKDPLEALRGSHPILEPLLEYRRLEASEPRLASRDLYQQLRDGTRHAPLMRARARFKAGPAEGGTHG